MPGRIYSAETGYRYGFNGKENDNEVKGEGIQLDYGMRIYDARLGRFLSVDPLSGNYPFYTPYSFAGNKPVQCIDLDGEEESIPYLQSAAFDNIATSVPGVSYVRGKAGDKLGTTLPEPEKGSIASFIESISPFRMMPIEPAPHVAQAVNFGNSLGAVVYDLEDSDKGVYTSVTTKDEASTLSVSQGAVFLNISGYSTVGQEIKDNLKTCHGLKDLTDAEIADYISSVKIIFRPGYDYSHYFWQKNSEIDVPNMMLAGNGTTVLPLPASSTPIIMPPLGSNTASLNSPDASVVVNTDAMAQELAATIAPSILKMAEHKKNARASTKPKHQAGQARKKQDQQGSKGMKKPKNKRPPGHKGPWPPKEKQNG